MNNLEIISSTIEAIRSVVSDNKNPLALHEPFFNGNEWNYTKECLDTGWVSSAGEFVNRFEADLAAYTGSKQVVTVVNGTSALHICLLLAGVRRDDEVLLPALTFVATANAVSYCGAIPHFIDSEGSTLGIDPEKLAIYLENFAELRSDGCYNLRTGRRIKAVVPMHTFGHPVNLNNLTEVCKKFELELVEDAAESLGSFYRGKHTGNYGKISALSFNGNKIITTGGGGAILTNDEELGHLAKHVTTTAKAPHRWEYNHDMVGYNYRMPNINAAMGCAQLEQISIFVEAKRQLAECYCKAFKNVRGVSFFTEPADCKSNYWLNTILLDEDNSSLRNELLAAANDAGIMARPAWTLMHKLPMYVSCPRMELSVAESLARRLINIPSSVFLRGDCAEA